MWDGRQPLSPILFFLNIKDRTICYEFIKAHCVSLVSEFIIIRQ